MLASPLSAAFMGDQPMVIIPQHAMPSSAPESFYYNNAFGLGGQGMRTSFPSFGGAVTAHGSPMMTNAGGVSPVAPNAFSSNGASFGSPGVLQSPLSAHAFHPSAFPLASNDMAVDDHTPTSPSSSNSNDLDEYVLAVSLHSLSRQKWKFGPLSWCTPHPAGFLFCSQRAPAWGFSPLTAIPAWKHYVYAHFTR